MNIATVSTESPVNFQNLIALEDQNGAEAKKGARSAQRHFQDQRIEAARNEIGELKSQQKNMWLSAIFNTFIQVASSLAKLWPGVGTIVGSAIKQLEALNPFAMMIEKSKVAAKEFQLEEDLALKQEKLAEKYVSQGEDHRQKQVARLEQALGRVQQTQDATLRV